MECEGIMECGIVWGGGIMEWGILWSVAVVWSGG